MTITPDTFDGKVLKLYDPETLTTILYYSMYNVMKWGVPALIERRDRMNTQRQIESPTYRPEITS